MKKFLIVCTLFSAIACTNPENNVDNPGDTAGVGYDGEDRLNTNIGPTDDKNSNPNAGLDTSNFPQDTARLNPERKQ